ncbi:MAG TPA: DUF4468 domain-containing protein [Mucilaginibacter sp.]|jgi:hypothetical protein|nr:DUF4468 domain-containing protein [Mucilaginibacter sp.]
MKIILLIASFITLSISSYAQNDTVGLHIPIKDSKIVYEGVIQIPERTKQDLLNNAKQWFVDYFKDSKNVIQNEDKDQGRIVGKGIIVIQPKAYDKITIQIDCKDGKYRYRIYDMIGTIPAHYDVWVGNVREINFLPEDLINKLTIDGEAPFTKNKCRKFLESINAEITTTIESLKKAMSAKPDDF